MTEPLLFHGDTERSQDLFHAVPHAIIDPFLLAELDGRSVAVIGVLDADKVRESGVEVLDPSAFGLDELLNAGRPRLEAELEVALRACRELGVQRAAVPYDFPVALADHLRAGGIELTVDDERVVARRRVKTAAQLEGIRRAQRAADAAMARAAELLHGLPAGLTSEQVREAMQAVCAEHDAELFDDAIVAHGAQSAIGHDSGSGPVAAGRAGGGGHLAARPRVALLGGHDAHVRGRRRRAARRAGGVLAAVPGLARGRDAAAARGRGLPRDLRPQLRALRGGGQAHAAHEGPGQAAGPAATTTASGTASASRSTSARCSAAARTRSSPATSSRSSRGATGRASAAAGWRTSRSSPTTAARCSPTSRTTSDRAPRAARARPQPLLASGR